VNFDITLANAQWIKNVHPHICPNRQTTSSIGTDRDGLYRRKELYRELGLIQSSRSGAIFAGRGINSTDNQFIDDNLKHLLAISRNG